MSQSASFFMPSVSLFGANVLTELAARVVSLGGTKPLIVTDKGMTQLGYTKQVTDLLDQADIAYVVFDETIPNPTDKNVEEGVDAYKKGQCDMLISL
ncbi:MAG: iron-containing alcohol dehydrogenase, partial [Pseudoalteromonas distincta]